MSVTIELSEGEAAHLTWLLSTGHTQTPWLAQIIQRLNEQIPEGKRLIRCPAS